MNWKLFYPTDVPEKDTVQHQKKKKRNIRKLEYESCLVTFFFIFTFLKMACTLQVLANMAPNAVVYPTMRIHVRTCQDGRHMGKYCH